MEIVHEYVFQTWCNCTEKTKEIEEVFVSYYGPKSDMVNILKSITNPSEVKTVSMAVKGFSLRQLERIPAYRWNILFSDVHWDSILTIIKCE